MPVALDNVALADQIFSQGGGRFDHQAWIVTAGTAMEALSRHERYHRVLNDITLFGAVLNGLAYLSRDFPDENNYRHVLTRLVARCRITHEMWATYMGLAAIEGDEQRREQLQGNIEYQNYYDLAAELVARLPTRPLGLIALGGVVRIAMNGPLPDDFVNGRLSAIRLSDFRAADAPDHRLLQCRQLLDRSFWTVACEKAKARLGSHPHWSIYLDSNEEGLRPHHIMSMAPVGDLVSIGQGGIDPSFENDVANFLIDQAFFFLRNHTIETYTLARRREIESSIQSALASPAVRFYNAPERHEVFNLERDSGREQIRLRTEPRRVKIHQLATIQTSDWAAYNQIREEEGDIPVYMRSVEDIMLNHGLDRGDIPTAADVACFLRKKREDPDRFVGVDLHFVSDPERLDRLFRMTGGAVRICISGRWLAEASDDALNPWVEIWRGMSMSVILDTHPEAIFRRLNPAWEALVWDIETLPEAGGQSVLFIFPIGPEPLPPIGLFRPASYASADAVIKLINPEPISLMVRRTGIQIQGLSTQTLQSDWMLPEHLVWTAKRLLDEETVFCPATPEEQHRGLTSK